jgi:uncharacterized protein with NAD-binding domain and iron-sulfur cluster
MADRVVIIGAGLAGLAAAAALAPRGYAVTLLEARGRLGGRASSFTDAVSGQLIDACQHVSMGCCTNLAHFCRTVGIHHLLETQPCLYFMTPDGRVSRFRADPLPAPVHLARAFLTAHYLSPSEKARVAWGLAWLRLTGSHRDEPFLHWLERHGQTPGTVERFWGVVLTSALNETPERIGLRYARKVFVDGFLRRRRGFEVELPRVPLGRLYGDELQAWLTQHHVELLLGRGVKELRIGEPAALVAGFGEPAAFPGGRRQTRQLTQPVRHPQWEIHEMVLRDGSRVQADWYISAVPFDRLLDLVPNDLVAAEPYFGNLRRLQTSPITSVHLWFDRPVTALPHVVLLCCAGQWLFNRGETAPGEHYVQVVVSAARQFRGLGHEEVQRQVVAELGRLFPDAASARLLRGRVVTEHTATFSVTPGVDQWRPAQASPVRNLFVAGDWTHTGWPATMEGAVRSGYLAAQTLLRRRGANVRLVQPDL